MAEVLTDHYAASDPLHHGLAVGHAIVLVAIATAATLIAPAAFARRDLSA